MKDTLHDTIDATAARSCYLCAAEGTTLSTDLRDIWLGVEGGWGRRRCPSCDLAWLDPRPQREELWKLYADGYHTHSISHDAETTARGIVRRIVKRAVLPQGQSAGPDLEPRSRLEGLAVERLRRLRPVRDIADGQAMWIAQTPGTLLDVGCGNGELLVRMRELGWAVMGVEPDPASAAVARDHHQLDVVAGSLEDARLPRDAFDVVTMSHVIEHVHDPIDALKECLRLLKPGGHLVAVTPNLRSLGRLAFGDGWLGWDVPRHLYVFSRRSLRACVERAGMEVEVLRTTARSTFRQLPSMARFIKMLGTPGASDAGRMGARLFWLIEAAASRLVGCGEEILLIARRPA